MMTFTNTTGNLGEIMDKYLDARREARETTESLFDTDGLPDWDVPCVAAIVRSRRLARAGTPVNTEKLLGFVDDVEFQDELRLS